MAMIDAMLAEMEEEAQGTRRLLERVPEDKLGWKPHPKSFSLGQLALHVAQLPGGIAELASVDEFQVPEFAQKEPRSRAELLEAFEDSLARARAALGTMGDQRLQESWTLKDGEQVLMTVPRAALLRSLMLNHYYHHRGQLTVYLRLLDVPLPSVYGPTADENPFAGVTASAG